MIYYADGITIAEALAAQRRLYVLLSFKLKLEYSEFCGFVHTRMSLEILRSSSLLLRGTREKEVRIRKRPEMLDGGGDVTDFTVAGIEIRTADAVVR